MPPSNLTDQSPLNVEQALADFLCREFCNNDHSRLPQADQPLLSTEGGIVDSVGLYQLITFIESELGTPVDDRDIVPENFQSLRALTAYVKSKQKR
jgi:acyl carrier protein